MWAKHESERMNQKKREVKNNMFKSKKENKVEEIEEAKPVDDVEEIEDEIEDETTPVKDNKEEVESEEVPTPEQKVNLTPGEVISIVEFNLNRAIQSLQLLK